MGDDVKIPSTSRRQPIDVTLPSTSKSSQPGKKESTIRKVKGKDREDGLGAGLKQRSITDFVNIRKPLHRPSTSASTGNAFALSLPGSSQATAIDVDAPSNTQGSSFEDPIIIDDYDFTEPSNSYAPGVSIIASGTNPDNAINVDVDEDDVRATTTQSRYHVSIGDSSQSATQGARRAGGSRATVERAPPGSAPSNTQQYASQTTAIEEPPRTWRMRKDAADGLAKGLVQPKLVPDKTGKAAIGTNSILREGDLLIKHNGLITKGKMVKLYRLKGRYLKSVPLVETRPWKVLRDGEEIDVELMFFKEMDAEYQVWKQHGAYNGS